MLRLLAILVTFIALSQCVKAATLSIPTDQTEIQEGKRVYIITCAKCHNTNPHKPGSIGPDLYTTPIEVFRTKVPTGTYPSGYTPKRRTKVMPKLPSLTNRVDQIYKYIRSIPK